MAIDKKRVAKNIDKLKKALKKGKKWRGPSDVHKLRTRIRRVQSVLESAQPQVKLSKTWLLKKLKRLHKKAGKVRDLDVMTGHLSSLHVSGEDDCLIQLQQHLGFQRHREEKRLRRAVQKQRAAVSEELSNSARRVEKTVDNNSKEESATAASALKLSAKLANPITLNRNNLHGYRTEIKDLRDILQLGVGSRNEKLVDALGKAKDAIGEWHDWEELVAIANEILGHGPGCKLLQELKKKAGKEFETALSLTNKMRKTYFQASGKEKSSRRSAKRGRAAPAVRAAAKLVAQGSS